MATGPLCSIKNCRNPVRVKSRGWCNSHYLRWLRHGDPTAGNTAPGAGCSFVQKALHAETDDCVTWPLGTNGHGYGLLVYNGERIAAHRLVCILAHGDPPSPELFALHSCGNGHLGCVNPVTSGGELPKRIAPTGNFTAQGSVARNQVAPN